MFSEALRRSVSSLTYIPKAKKKKRITSYSNGTGLQLSATAATKYYFNPDIPETAEIRNL